MMAALTVASVSAPTFAATCRDHIQSAEAANLFPSGLMLAIGHEESGLDPYAINADGVSFHPASQIEAEAMVRTLQSQGARYIDVGCMQIDLHYHPDAFHDLSEAFDPFTNVAYGARLLNELLAQHGSWPTAIAHYHSSEPSRQADYLGKVASRYAALKGLAPTLSIAPADLRPRPKLKTVKLSVMTVERPSSTTAGGSSRWWR
ncbi:lytic transglycosylase domain-containing protein [Telmatospirillum siberiense]|nr:lytic transglycosylase domain-containing protein [Telmatospirillum siberiense]